MPSVTLELAKYLQREGIQVVGDPYVEFHGGVGGPLEFTGSSTSVVPLFGVVTLYRFSNVRWLVQWFQLGMYEKYPNIIAQEVIDLLERTLSHNKLVKSIKDVTKGTNTVILED